MLDHTHQLLELLSKDAVEWDRAAEDMDFVTPLLGDAANRKSAEARAACYRQFAARDRAAVNHVKQELLERENVTALH